MLITNKYFYTCESVINDLLVDPVAGQGYMIPILACQDKKIRILNDRGD